MNPFETRHEQVVLCQDQATGLRAIIAVYSTALGPAIGGTRFYPYPTVAAAVEDVLRLSKAMAYKAACADLPFGGAKGVIIGDPAVDKNDELLQAYGRFVESLGGRYVTGCDVGTYCEDMDVVAETSQYVIGRTPDRGGSGDTSVLTALGVYSAMRAAAEHVWGSPSLRGRRVGIAGVGKVGRRLTGYLVADGAEVVVADTAGTAVATLGGEYPQVEAVDPGSLAESSLDVYAPCAVGSALANGVADRLQAQIVCGAANNQLGEEIEVAETLHRRGIVYIPDYVAGAGGLIQGADEVGGYDAIRARARTESLFDATRRLLAQAAAEDVSPELAARRQAERRLEPVPAA
jgi:valine dehydrogenase (NAD+)